MSDKVKEPKFKKQLVWFDKKEYEKHISEGKQKLILLAQAVEFMSRYIKKVDSQEAVKVGFEIYFLNELLSQNKKFTEMGINNPLKVLDLLDISISELIRIEDEFETMKEYDLVWNEGVAKVVTKKEAFCIYTEDHVQNAELKLANNLIKAINDVSEVKTLQPMSVIRAFNGFINYNWTTHEYSWNFNVR